MKYRHKLKLFKKLLWDVPITRKNNMSTTSASISTQFDQHLKALEFWHRVEFFVPFDLQKLILDSDDSNWSTRQLTETDLSKITVDELWSVLAPDGYELNGFELYLGVFDKAELTTIVKGVVNEVLTSNEEFEQVERGELEGKTCFARIRMNSKGEALFSDVSISTVPWALGVIQNEGIEELSFDSFESAKVGLQELLANYQTQQVSQSRTSVNIQANGEAQPIDETVDHPLSGSDILNLLDVFYVWAKYHPKPSNCVVAIRARAGKLDAKLANKSKIDASQVVTDSIADVGSAASEIDEEIETETIDSEITILNSFYIKDIERAIAALKNNQINAALSSYLTAAPDNSRTDLYTTAGREYIFNSLRPSTITSGHWLDDKENVMSLMQQFAIGQIFEKLENGGIYSVNGPPGTGKTTMLRDIFAENIVRRARVLSKFKKADDAFQSRAVKVKFIGSEGEIEISPIAPELTGFEMVVASTNNAAVENISLDLPKTNKLGKEWINEDGASKCGYLKTIAHKIAAQNNKGRYEKIKEGEAPWGLVSCALGNTANRKKFVKHINKPKSACDKPESNGFDPNIHHSFWMWRKKYKGICFTDAIKNFKSADKAVLERLAGLQELATLFNEIHLTTEDVFCGHEIASLLAAENAETASQFTLDDIGNELVFCQTQLANLEREETLIKEGLPGVFFGLFKWSLKKRLTLELQINQIEQRDLLKSKHTLLARQATAKSQLRDTKGYVKVAKESLSKRVALWKSKSELLAQLAKDYPLATRPESLDDLELDNWQISGVWRDDELNKLRSELFYAALQLHEAWLSEAKQLTMNIFAVCNLLDGKRLQTTQHAAAIWQSLFMLVPVISSAFASIGNQFKELGSNSLGWLFIDEAGQAVPQAAVGALWRCKRAVVVGDPLQIEPVFTVPIKLIEKLFRLSGLPNDTKIMPHRTSIQSLADEANQLGTNISSNSALPQWIGSPLRVHRRCIDPMFTVANTIAYDQKMVYGLNRNTPYQDTENIGGSAWINVPGNVQGKQSVPAQIDFVFKSFFLFCQSQRKLPPLYIISPFKQIRAELIKEITDMGRWKDSNNPGIFVPKKTVLDEWCKKHIGTVHTFQGKEMSIVWMVLGCDSSNLGPVAWASQKPNLLNVAVTRAKHRFFMIGDVALWGNKSYFESARNLLLLTITPQEFVRRFESPAIEN